MFRNFIFTIAAAAGLFLSAQGAAVARIDKVKFEEAFLSRYVDMDMTGASVIVLKEGETIYSGSFGEADITAKVPFTGHTLIRAGEASLPVISIAVCQLAEEGRLSLDADVSDYLGFRLRNPKYPTKPITLRMLLTGTSSVTADLSVNKVEEFDAARNPEGVASVFTSAKPGTKYLESPVACALAAAVVEKVSGERFDRYAREHIFAPLGIEAWYDPSEAPSDRLAESYIWNLGRKGYLANTRTWLPVETNGYVLGESTFSLHPHTGLIISADGLARLVKCVMEYGACPPGGRIYSRATGEELLRPQAARKRRSLAFQHNTSAVPDYVIVNSIGYYRGISVCIYFNVGDQVAMIAVSNGARDSAPDSDGVIGNHFDREMRKLFTNFLID